MDELKQAQAEAEARDANAQIGEDGCNFELDRGWYLSSDVGVLISLGNQAGYSNLQPFVSIRGGYDLDDMFSVQTSISMVISLKSFLRMTTKPLNLHGENCQLRYDYFAVEVCRFVQRSESHLSLKLVPVSLC